MKMPAQQRPNFMPEGLSKWLMGLTNGIKGKIDKKWFRENISYDLDDSKIPNLPMTARETMLLYSVKGKTIVRDKKLGNLGLGIVQVSYEDMFDVWTQARKAEAHTGRKPETTFLDVQNGFKYGNVMNILRSDPSKHNSNDKKLLKKMTPVEKLAQQDYISIYDDDRIAVLICQDKKAGCLDEKLNIAGQNGLRLSFRSDEGTIHAELLAQLFGGGGHGGAAGARIDLPGVGFKTPLGVEINGKIETNPQKILNQLEENYKIRNHKHLSEEDKQKLTKTINIAENKYGKPCAELIQDIVTEIRKKEKTGNKENNVLSFSGKKETGINQTTEQEEKSSAGKLTRTDKLITRIKNFLEEIKDKPDYKLAAKEKTRLKEAEKLLNEKELYLNKLAENIKKAEEIKKLQETKANLARTKELLVLRKKLEDNIQPLKPVIYLDVPERIKKELKPEDLIRQEIDKLNSRPRIHSRQKSIVDEKLDKINEKLNKLDTFINSISAKANENLKAREKSQLSQIAPMLIKIEDELDKLKGIEEKDIKIQKNNRKNRRHKQGSGSKI